MADPTPGVTPVTARPRRRVFVAAVMVACLTVGLVVGTIGLALLERSPALRILAEEDAGHVAQNDGRIFVFTRSERSRACKLATTHWLFTMVKHDDTGDLVRAYVPIAEDGPVPVTALGVTGYILSVPLPPGLWPAQWYWIEARAETCGLLGAFWPIYSESAPLLLNIERNRAIADTPVTALRNGETTTRSRSPLAGDTVSKP